MCEKLGMRPVPLQRLQIDFLTVEGAMGTAGTKGGEASKRASSQSVSASVSLVISLIIWRIYREIEVCQMEFLSSILFARRTLRLSATRVSLTLPRLQQRHLIPPGPRMIFLWNAFMFSIYSENAICQMENCLYRISLVYKSALS